MDKMQDNKTDKLLNEMTRAFDMLRNSLNAFDAFRIIFIIFHYKAIESRYEEFAKSEPGFVKNNQGLKCFFYLSLLISLKKRYFSI